MHNRAIALALPLTLGIACSHETSSGKTAQDTPSERLVSATAYVAPTADPAAPGTDTDSSNPTGATTAGREATAAVAATATAARGSKDPIIEQGDPVKGHAEDNVVTGKIAYVSRNGVVIVSDTGEQHALFIVPETSVEVNGQDAHSSDLSQGQDVRASFDEQDGRNVAVRIRATGAAKALGPEDSTSNPSASPDQGNSSSLDQSGSGTSPDSSTPPPPEPQGPPQGR